MDVSNCTTVGDAKNTLIIYSTFATAASIFYATAVILILKTRAHRRFVHRLTLYLAISGIFSASSFLLQVIPLDVAQPDDSPASVRPGWAGMCAFGGFIVQYAGFVKTLMMLWISVYIFIVVMFQRQLSGQLKYEVSGVLVVVVTPFVLSLLLILVAVSSLVRKVAKRFLKQHHWLVIRDIMPLVPYPLVHSLVWLARLIDLSVGTKLRPFGIVTVVLLQSCSVILPLSLLVRSSVRSKLCRRIDQIPLQSPCEDGSNYSLYEN
ncbi:hypothetical protein EMCRGX_G018602 [Ephydatia muelleri]